LLPLIKAEEESKAPAPAPVRGGTETVLVAEDDVGVRALTKHALEKAGYTVIVAEDGDDALHKFIENREAVRLLVLDVVMPGKNGHEVVQEIRKVKPDIKVMFLSGYTADLVQRGMAMEEGMAFLQKPVSPNELARKVRDILDS
jgi:DNA-binding response OmpR family regulator